MLNEDRSSRRGVLAAGIGGALALAAQALGRPQTASATHEGYVQLGHSNSTAGLTSIHRTGTSAFVNLAPGAAGLLGEGPDVGVAGRARATDGHGVDGQVYADVLRGVAVYGATGGHWSQVAVDGLALGGVGEGIGVRGRTKNGIGVYAEATGGFALQVVGRAVFSRSGKTTIAGGSSTKTVSGFAIVPETVVVATVQGNPTGVWVRNVSLNDAQNTFTIRLNKSAPSGGVTVGYFIVN